MAGCSFARRIPLAKALELTLTGDPIDASEAAALGLINKVVPADQVLDEAIALAERIAANGPLGVQASKTLVRKAAFEPAADVWKLHNELQASVFTSRGRQGRRYRVRREASAGLEGSVAMDIKGKKAVVVGGASGMAKASAELLKARAPTSPSSTCRPRQVPTSPRRSAAPSSSAT